jgi:hypothetical protein
MNKRKFSIDWTKANKAIEEQKNARTSFKDERIYYPQFKDDGTAQAIIRFLPSPDTDLPYIDLYSHSYKGPGGWYIENCPTTIPNEKCPFCEANRALVWKELPEVEQNGRKRKLSYYTNILVVKDPMHPENEGKVWLFKFGAKIHTKIMEKWKPPKDSIDPECNVFDFYDGANFKLLIKKTKAGDNKMPNYDSSHFDIPSELDDALIEKIMPLRYSLKNYRVFKSYNDLKDKFDRIMGTSSPAPTATAPKSSTNSNNEATVKSETKAKVDDDKEPAEEMFSETDDTFFADLEKGE